MAAAKLVVSRAQGEYEQLEKEREDQEAGLGKRTLDDAEGGRDSKRARREEDDDEMEIEMEDDEDGQSSLKYHDGVTDDQLCRKRMDRGYR